MARKHLAHANMKHISKDGTVLWEAYDLPNVWHDEGELVMLSAIFAQAYSTYGATPITNWSTWFGLSSNAIAEGDTLASITGEPSGDGYARELVECSGTGLAGQDYVITQPAAAYQVTSKTVTFTASGGAWAAVTNLFLCTHPSAVASSQYARLLCTIALSSTRTLQDGDSLQGSMVIGISEA